MLTEQDVIEKLENDSYFIRQLCLTYLDACTFKRTEANLGIHVGVLEKVFYEYPRYERMFDEELSRQAQGKLFREGQVNVFKLTTRLLEVAEDTNSQEDGGPTIKDVVSAANTLAKLYDSVLKQKGDKKKDALDSIFDEVKSERTSGESSQDM